MAPGPTETEEEIEVEIELNPEEPAFLLGQSSRRCPVAEPPKLALVEEGQLAKALAATAEASRRRREARLAASDILPPVEAPPSEQSAWLPPRPPVADSGPLPIHAYREELVSQIRRQPVLIVVGETGSGKTTQLPQFALAGGLASGGIIGCTQPRRIAAISVAKRVAEEMSVSLGEEVGYCVRFDDRSSPRTKLKYMTDGMLLREALTDPDLSAYAIIVLDEAHERTVATDVLFGLLKGVCSRRPHFRLVITSATLEASKFSSFFFDCPLYRIPGRAFPVEIRFSLQAEDDYVESAVSTAFQIHLSHPPGDVLVFLTGQEEIEAACDALRARASAHKAQPLIVTPLYAALPAEKQSAIFDAPPPGTRKIVVATNVAEASVTIDGILYVVDCGFCKVKVYDAKLGGDVLKVAPISRAAAEQRAGRAGRTAPGICFRLYTQAAYRDEFLAFPVPEIQRSELSSTVLLLKALGVNDLLHFDFLDAPAPRRLVGALESLFALGALDASGGLTPLGRLMAEFPLPPPLAKAVLAAADLGCLVEVISVVAAVVAEGLFARPRDKAKQADERHARFKAAEGDHITLLRVFEAWRAHGESPAWAMENFLHARALKRTEDIRRQLMGLCTKARLPVLSCGADTSRLRKALTAGFFARAARREGKDTFRTLSEGNTVFLHPASALFGKNPDFVVFNELVFTTKEYMRGVSVIDPRWLVHVAPAFYRFADSLTSSKRLNMKVVPINDKDPRSKAGNLNKRLRNLDALMQ